MEENYNEDQEWTMVTYHKKKNKNNKRVQQEEQLEGGGGVSDVFRSIEEKSEERRRKLMEAKKAAQEAENSASAAGGGDGDNYDDSDVEAAENGGGAEDEKKKRKEKKLKKPKVTVAEAAAKIDASDLASFFAEISVSYETQQDIQLMRFADYFGRAFMKVKASQFPWMKILRESSVAKMVDLPLSHLPENVYKTSADWLNQRSFEALGSFVLWALDNVFADLTTHQGAGKGSKKAVQQAAPKSQVAMFMVLAMVLRRKPDVLLSLLQILKENTKHQVQDKLPVVVWVITQACQGDLVVGLFMWVHLLLPILCGKSNCNPQSRDLILQLVERILSYPKARIILVNGAVRKGDRLVPPSALELLMRATFPAPSARIKATERFEVIYPTLKEVALVASPGSKAMKQITQHIMSFAIKAVGEGVPDLSEEAAELFLWCLTQNPECYRQWENLYLENLDASVTLLRKLSEEWKLISNKHVTLDPLKEALKSFSMKNEEAASVADDTVNTASLKDAQRYCKLLMGRLSSSHGCMKGFVLLTVAAAIGVVFMAKDLQSLDLKNFLADFNIS